MSSFLRNLQRKAARKSSDYVAKPQPFEINDDGSYRTLHPTRGWRHVCARRARYYASQL